MGSRKIEDVMANSEQINPIEYGAVGDAKTVCTHAIQESIDRCAAVGGGIVCLPRGRYVTGTLFLKSGVTLDLEEDCILLGSTDLSHYRRAVPKTFRSYTDIYTEKSLIYAESEHDVAITGQGTIDGQGQEFSGPYLKRPYGIRFVTCTDVRVENVTLRNSAMWMQHYLACDRVTIRGIKVWNHSNINNDMIDIDGCHDVLITECIGDSSDDGITIKSSCDRPCENVTVANCTVASHCSAIKCGTESNGGFKNIHIADCIVVPSKQRHVINGCHQGWAGLALEIVDGGTLDNVTADNITIDGSVAPIFMRLGDRGRPVGPDRSRPAIGSMRNISLSNIKATGGNSLGCVIAGLEGNEIENVTMRDLDFSFKGGGTRQDMTRCFTELPNDYPESVMFTKRVIGPIAEGDLAPDTFRLRGETCSMGRLPAYGLFFWHVKNVSLENISLSTLTPDERPAVIFEDAVGAVIDGQGADGHSKDLSKDILFVANNGI